MFASCPICEKPCLPGEDLIQGIAVSLQPNGVKRPLTDSSLDITIHRDCIKAAHQRGGKPTTVEVKPKAAQPPAKPGVKVERADVLSFLA